LQKDVRFTEASPVLLSVRLRPTFYKHNSSSLFVKYMKKTFKVTNINPRWKDTTLDIFLNFLGAIIFILLKG